MSARAVVGTGADAAISTDAEIAMVLDDLRSQRRALIRRQLGLGGIVALILAGGFSLEILVGGSAGVPLRDIPIALIGRADGLANFVVYETRLPRALMALLVGALFGLSGSLYQRLVSNVLATPDIIGVSAGASTGAVVIIVGAGATGLAVQAGAVIGAAAAATLIFGLSWKRGSSTYRLILIGIGVGACFSAATSYLLTFADAATSTRAMRWMIGTLSGAQWSDIRVLVITLVAALVVARLIGAQLTTVQLGDSLATALGTRVQMTRIGVLVVGAVLAAIATSVAGPIPFIALVAGPIAQRVLPGAGPVPAAMVGAALLAIADAAAQSAPLISPVPTGVLTGLIGAPVLVLLLIRGKAS